MKPESVPCIVLIRPVSPEDPSLLADAGGPLLPRLLSALSRLPQIGEVRLSAPESVPWSLRRRLVAAGLTVDYCAREFPQHRLLALMDSLGLERALVLTSYSYLLDAGEIADLMRLHGPDGGVTATAPSLAMDHLALVSRGAVATLAESFPATPVTPLYFHEFAERCAARPTVRLLKRPQGQARRFLSELLLDTSRGLLPPDMLAAHFERLAPGDWLRRGAHDRLLLDLAGARDLGELGRVLEGFDEDFRRGVAKQVRFVRKLKPLVRPGARFLELGFGMSLLSSLCLLEGFGEAAAVEPYPQCPEHLEYSRELFRCLGRHYPRTLPLGAGEGADASLSKRLDVHLKPLEELGLASGSLDLCFSHVVFEHVKPVEAVSRELHRLLRPGGVMLHEIGLMDHTRNSNNIEFEFLRHSREEWAALDQSTNLWRVNDFMDLWTRLGFSVDVVERHVRVLPPTSLHPSWAGYAEEDLYCYKALVRAVKN